MKVKNKILALILIIIVIFVVFVSKNKSDLLQLFVCDVGQGDGVVIKTIDAKLIVIDGGPDRKILDCLEELNFFKQPQIDVLVLTHPHKDHVAGLVEILDRYKVKDVYLSYDLEYSNNEYEVFKKKLQLANIHFVVAGKSVNVGTGVSLNFVWPIEGYISKNVNDVSVVTVVNYGQSCFLEAGDAGADFEKYYVSKFGSCQVLKVGHHGSKFSTSAGFLSAVQPDLAVISSGENTYGHPNIEMLGRLAQIGSKILRTDQGAIKIVSDGTEWYIAGN